MPLTWAVVLRVVGVSGADEGAPRRVEEAVAGGEDLGAASRR